MPDFPLWTKEERNLWAGKIKASQNNSFLIWESKLVVWLESTTPWGSYELAQCGPHYKMHLKFRSIQPKHLTVGEIPRQAFSLLPVTLLSCQVTPRIKLCSDISKGGFRRTFSIRRCSLTEKLFLIRQFPVYGGRFLSLYLNYSDSSMR